MIFEKNNQLLEKQKDVEKNDEKIKQLKEEIGQVKNENKLDELLKEYGI